MEECPMEKGILMKINLSKVNFTNAEEHIAEYFINENPPLPIHDLAKTLCVSSSSITRFCKKIGLNNYKELLFLYEKCLNNEDVQYLNIPNRITNEYSHILKTVDELFDEKAIYNVCNHIYNHRLISVFAFGLSATAAEDFKFRFSRVGKFVEVIHDKEAIEMYSKVLEEGDLVFIFTLRGKSYLDELAIELKKKGIIVISILGNQKSLLASISDEVLFTSMLSGEESTGLISSQFPILVVIDALYDYYVRDHKDALQNWASTEEYLKTKQ